MTNNKYKFATHKAKYKGARLYEKQTWKGALLEVTISWLNYHKKYQMMTFCRSSEPLRLSCHFKCTFRMCLKCIDMICQNINSIHPSNTQPHGKTMLQDTTLGPEPPVILKEY